MDLHLSGMMTIFKPILFVFLAFAIFTQQGGKTLILLDYCLNKKYIAATFCENRNRPQLHCNGKCHLRKALKKDDARQGNENRNVNEREDVSCWENHAFSEFSINRIPEVCRKSVRTVERFYSAPSTVPFHPPCE